MPSTGFAKALSDGVIVKVVFRKKDGTTRTLNGTTDLKKVPKVDHPSKDGKKADSPGVQRIYDLDIGEWRSVILTTIKKWEPIDYELV